MIIGNKATRDHAQPFVAEFIEFSSFNYGGSILSAPQTLATGKNTIAIPMTQPEKADITEAYLFMELLAPSDVALQVLVGIGYYDGQANEIIPETDYTQAYLMQEHLKATGNVDAFTVAANGTLLIEADFSRSIPRRGDVNYISDGFVLLVTFLNNLPSSANSYALKKFKLSCTAQIGLGT